MTRRCLDVLRSARARRETYVGPWLPEPLVTADGGGADAADPVLLAESVRMAFLVVLESLSPAERVAFVLHDVFGYGYPELASGTTRGLALSAVESVPVNGAPGVVLRLGDGRRRRRAGRPRAPRPLVRNPDKLRHLQA